MLQGRQNAGLGLGLAERRARRRLETPLTIFARLNDRNGGIVLNLSEEGLAFSAVRAVQDEAFLFLQIQFPESPEWIPISAQVVWQSECKRSAGVRFVGLSEDARRRIVQWISAHPALGESRSESKARSVLAHGIEAGESGVQLPYPTVYSDLEPLVDAMPEAVDEPNDQAKQLRGANTAPLQRSVSALERRSRRRTRIVPLGYLQLGEGNGGIALNVSEDGLAITAAVVLADDYLPQIRLYFPDSDDCIEATGEIVWRSESQKEAGVRFVGLSAQARQQIRNWVSSQAASDEGGDQFEDSSRTEEKPAEIVKPPVHVATTATTDVHDGGIDSSGDSVLLIPDSFCLPDVDAPIPAAQSYAAVQGQATHGPPQYRIKPRDSSTKAFAAALLVVSISAGIVLFLRRDERVRATVPLGETAVSRTVDHDVPAPVSDSVSLPNSDATIQPDQRAAQTDPTAGHRNEEVDPLRNPIPQSVVGDKPRDSAIGAVVAHSRASASTLPVIERDEHISKWTSVRPITNVSRKVNGSTPDPLPQLENDKPAQANDLSNSPNGALYAAMARKEKPVAAAIQPEASVTPSPTVEILTDPYPSIRMLPEQITKKKAKANSFQLGELTSRTDPVDPEEAKQHGVEGTVTLHAIIARDGTIARMDADGPPALVEAAKNAVHQWRYTQTLVGRQPVETEENIRIMFRLSR